MAKLLRSFLASYDMKNCIYFILLISFPSYASDKLASDDKSPQEVSIAILEIDDIQSKIALYLNPKDYTSYTHLNRHFRTTLFNTPGSIGESLRKVSDFSIKIGDRYYFLEEFIGVFSFARKDLKLDAGSLTIDKRPKPSNRFSFEVKHLAQLVKKRPEDFKTLVLATIPKTQENIENNLESYYKETTKMDHLISDLPKHEDPREALANVFIELIIWAQLRSQVWEQVGAQNGAHVGYQLRGLVGAQVGAQVGSQLWDQVAFQVWSQVEAEVWNQIEDHVGDQLWDQVGVHVGGQLEDQVGSDLSSHFDFTKTTDTEETRKKLKRAIEYTFTVYQLSSIPMRYSHKFKSIFDAHEDRDGEDTAGLLELIKEKITENQAETILENLKLKVPESPQGHYLVESQIKLLRRHLPN